MYKCLVNEKFFKRANASRFSNYSVFCIGLFAQTTRVGIERPGEHADAARSSQAHGGRARQASQEALRADRSSGATLV